MLAGWWPRELKKRPGLQPTHKRKHIYQKQVGICIQTREPQLRFQSYRVQPPTARNYRSHGQVRERTVINAKKRGENSLVEK